MKTGRRYIIIATAFCITGIILVTNKIEKATPAAPHKPQIAAVVPPANIPHQSLHPDEPQTLRIPTLDIEAPIQSVGLNPKGEMRAPDNAESVTWFRHGYLPGTPGNAVLAGHKDYKSRSAVFRDLHQLAEGGTAEIVTATHIQTFKVEAKQVYNAQSLEPSLFGPATEARLQLITCEGTWDSQQKAYTKRLVVSLLFVREAARTP